MKLFAATLFVVLFSLGCGEEPEPPPNPCAPELRVYVAGQFTCGTTCPAGTSEAYRDGPFLVCHECDDPDIGCDPGQTCVMQCGPGCEDDTAGCCGARVCDG